MDYSPPTFGVNIFGFVGLVQTVAMARDVNTRIQLASATHLVSEGFFFLSTEGAAYGSHGQALGKCEARAPGKLTRPSPALKERHKSSYSWSILF